MNLVVVALSTIIVYAAYKFGKLSQRVSDRKFPQRVDDRRSLK